MTRFLMIFQLVKKIQNIILWKFHSFKLKTERVKEKEILITIRYENDGRKTNKYTDITPFWMLPVLRGESTISSTEILIVLHFKVHKSTLSRLENNRTKFCCLFFLNSKFKVWSTIKMVFTSPQKTKKAWRPKYQSIWLMISIYNVLDKVPKELN